jgi:hypothetical protein
MSRRYSAAVCRNGHWISRQLELEQEPINSHCPKCGTRVLTNCPSCNAMIPGALAGVVAKVARPSPFCGSCGGAYPWASRNDRIQQLRDLVHDEDLDPADRLAVLDAIDDLSLPDDDENRKRIERAGARFKKLAPQVWTASSPILSDVLSSVVRRTLGLP